MSFIVSSSLFRSQFIDTLVVILCTSPITYIATHIAASPLHIYTHTQLAKALPVLLPSLFAVHPPIECIADRSAGDKL